MTVIEQISVLASHSCWCGRVKAKMHALCGGCWRALTPQQRQYLHTRIPGFGGAYEECREALKPVRQTIWELGSK